MTLNKAIRTLTLSWEQPLKTCPRIGYVPNAGPARMNLRRWDSLLLVIRHS